MSHRRLVRLAWVSVLAFAAIIPAATAQAREGFLDRSFGTDGRFVVPPPFEGASLLREEGDGSLIVSGEEAIGRFAPDGSFDTTFGEGGRLTVPKEIEGLDFSSFNWEFDGKGRMVVFGTATEPVGASEAPLQTFSGGFIHSIPRTWVVAMRYTAAGQIDPTFGEGKGFVRSDFGATPVPPGSGQKERQEFQIPGALALDVAVDSADRPVLLVGHEATRSPCYGKSGFESYPYAVVRLTDAGQLDPTFGEGGLRLLEGISSYPRPKLALDAAGQILVAGAEGSDCPDTGLILKLNQDGAPLGGAAGSGYTRLPGRYFAGLAPDGSMIFRHHLVGLGALSRTWPDGRPDRRFGKVWVESPPGARVQVDDILVDHEGRVLLGCAFTLPPGAGKPRRTFIAITRLRRDGKTDLGFGKQGWIKTSVPVGSSLGKFELDATGRLLISSGRRSEGWPIKLTFMRYVLDQEIVAEPAPQASGAPAASSSFSETENRSLAARDVEERLAALQLPAGARPVPFPPPGGHGAMKSAPWTLGNPNLDERHAWWIVPGRPLQIRRWFEAHPPAASELHTTGSSGVWGETVAWNVTFLRPAIPEQVDSRFLLINLIKHGPTETAVRADALGVWIEPHPPQQKIPAAARLLEVELTREGRPRRTAWTSNGALLKRVAKLMDELPVVQPGFVSCPPQFTAPGRPGPLTVRLRFRATRDAPALAEGIQTLPARNGACFAMGVKIHDKWQRSLEGASVVLNEVRRLMKRAKPPR